MYSVLLPVDGNVDRAMRQAKIVENLPDSSNRVHVTLLRVFDEPTVPDNSDLLEPTRVRSVADVREYLTSADITVELLGEAGDVGETIISVADALDSDVIVMGGRKKSPVGKAILGSVSQYVILNAGRPVMVTYTDD